MIQMLRKCGCMQAFDASQWTHCPGKNIPIGIASRATAVGLTSKGSECETPSKALSMYAWIS